MTPQDALCELLARLGAKQGRSGADQRRGVEPVACGSRYGYEVGEIARENAPCYRRGLSWL